MQQLTLHLEPGLARRNRSLRDHTATRVYARGLVDVAGKMDLSPSKLTEKLAGADSGGKPRGMTLDELEAYIERTGDVSPVHYLADKYLRDPAVAQQEALAKLAALAEVIPGLMAAAGLQSAPKGQGALMTDGEVLGWIVIDPETGEWCVRCATREEARELAMGVGEIAKVVRAH